MNMRSALITGATGFIGSALVRRLLADSVEVTCLTRPNTPPERLARIKGSRIVQCTYEYSKIRSGLCGVHADVLFNLASYGVHQNDRDSKALIDGNLGVLALLLEFAAESHISRVIHAGSCSEYGNPEEYGVRISETAALRPTSLYGAAKAAAELYGRVLASRLGLGFITLRVFGVYGVGEGSERLLPAILTHVLRGIPLDLTMGDQIRDFTYVDDVAEAFVVAARSENLQNGDAYNVCTGQGLSVREMGEAATRQLDRGQHLLRWGNRPYRLDEPMWLVGTNEKFSTATGWKPRIMLNEGIRRILEAQEANACGEHK